MKLDELAGKPLTYTEVGATATTMPDGYHHLRKSSVIGRGRDRFEQAAAAGMRWGMLRGAGLRVDAAEPLQGGHEPGLRVDDAVLQLPGGEQVRVAEVGDDVGGVGVLTERDRHLVNPSQR